MNRLVLSNTSKISKLRNGCTLTQCTPEKSWAGTAEAKARATQHIIDLNNIVYNVHTAGFGCTENIIDQAGNYNFKDLDTRLTWLIMCGVNDIMLTLYGAPSFMMEVVPNAKYPKLKASYYQKYADICIKILERYANYPIYYLQIWNEMKGWSKPGSYFDYVDYTLFYNTVVDAIRSRPEFDHILIGGPYPVLTDYIEMETDTLEYWYKNANYGDAICTSYSLSELLNTPLSKEEYLDKTFKFSNLVWNKYDGLEYWQSEYYFWSDLSRFDGLDIKFQACCTASILYHLLINDCDMALLWGLQGDGRFADDGAQNSLLVDTRGAWANPGTQIKPSRFLPGSKTPTYDVIKLFRTYAGRGEPYIILESSNTMIEGIQCWDHAIIINKNPNPVEIFYKQKRFNLDGYEVKAIQESLM